MAEPAPAAITEVKVREFNRAGQDINPKNFKNLEEAAKDVYERQARAFDSASRGLTGNKVEFYVYDRNGQRAITEAEMHVYDAAFERTRLANGGKPREPAERIQPSSRVETQAAQTAEKTAEKGLVNTLKKGAVTAVEEVAEHGRRFGVGGKALAVVAAGGLAMASGANAAEVGKESINAVVPGGGTLVLGEGPRHGVLCEAFGQFAGVTGGLVAGATIGGLTIWSGPGAAVAGGAAGLAAEAITTPAVTSLCKKLTM